MTVAVRILAAVLLTAVLAAPVMSAASQPPRTSADQEYVPVDPSAEQEQLPAAPLVIGAYSVIWVGVVLYLWSIWQRLSRVERELAQVSRRVQSGETR
jgi:CcmD family protein